MIEKRRSRRTVSEIPLEVRVVERHRIALTAVINRHGALILSPIPWAAGTQLEITNQRTGAMTNGRVVWCGGEDAPGSFRMGIEFDAVASEFWGDDYGG
jgi:PilZ domain-containing protein